MNLLALFGTIVGIILGLIEIRNYLQNSPENRNFARFSIGIVIVGVVVGFASNYFYFAPKTSADRFIDGFRNLDTAVVLETFCSDSELIYEFTGTNGSLVDFVSLFADVRIWDQRFDLMRQETSFSWTLSSFVGQNEIYRSSIRTKSAGLTDFCIYEITGLNLTSSSNVNNLSINISPTPSFVDNQAWSAYITNVREGVSAIEFIEARSSRDVVQERGWKVISFEIVYQSNQTWAPMLTVFDNTRIIDSTGTTRDLGTGTSIIEYTSCGLGNTSYFYLPEGARLGAWSWVKIPENASIEQIQIDILRDTNTFGNTNQDILYTFTINPETDTIDNPFTLSFMEDVPLLNSDNDIQVNIPNFANLTFTNPRFEPGSFNTTHVAIDLTIENLSSDNIDGSSFGNWGYVAVDDIGNYRREDWIYNDFTNVEDGIIPPGFTDTVTMELGHCSEQDYATEKWRIVGLIQNQNTFAERISPAYFQIIFDVP